ncbi:hypothetical protein NMY22_g14560 [Coprinellus aureogranulatus]|nr:hypothetical protein NMY22_g14560 [Coprinellus aureogranulatus]
MSLTTSPPSTDGIGIANLPNQRHKIVAKRGAHFTIMVVGESGLGKTTLINTLFSTELSPPKNYNKRHVKQMDKLTEVEIIKAELEEKQFKVKLTVIDTPGFGDYVNNRDSWLPIVEFIDDQHEAYMRQEQQPQRSEKTDLRVHACLYFIRPTGHTVPNIWWAHRWGKGRAGGVVASTLINTPFNWAERSILGHHVLSRGVEGGPALLGRA